MIDYLMDDSDDLQISGGDFVRGESNKQHQRALLICEKGEYKHAPLATVGITTYMNDDSPAELLREIRLRFSDDGMKIQQLNANGGNLQIVADYGR